MQSPNLDAPHLLGSVSPQSPNPLPGRSPGRGSSYLCSSHRLCTGWLCPGSSPAGTASCSRMAPAGTDAVGRTLEKKRRSSRPGHLGKLSGAPLPLSSPKPFPATLLTPPPQHVSATHDGGVDAQEGRPCLWLPGRQSSTGQGEELGLDSRAATC